MDFVRIPVYEGITQMEASALVGLANASYCIGVARFVDIKRASGMAHPTLKKSLETLVNRGCVIMIGDGANAYYKLAEPQNA